MKGRKTMGKSEVYFTSFKATGNGNLAFLRMKYRTVHGDVWHTVPSLRFTSRIWRRHLNII